uniref:Uncharacterized protein n=1 Tax=Globisporangium ultimum (strain ATCC 200006 / CBS 805.95 / DAOM BR144) TaxID=431595 RepID=K3WNZ1_GLOUD
MCSLPSKAQQQVLEFDPNVRVSGIAHAYWAVTHARQPEGTAVSNPQSATFYQMQHLDEMSSNLHDSVDQEREYKKVTVRLQGSSDLAISINIKELRAALGLPNYTLVADGIFRSPQPPPVPAKAVDDIAHINGAESD